MVRISMSDEAQWWDQNARGKSEETVVEEGERTMVSPDRRDLNSILLMVVGLLRVQCR